MVRVDTGFLLTLSDQSKPTDSSSNDRNDSNKLNKIKINSNLQTRSKNNNKDITSKTESFHSGNEVSSTNELEFDKNSQGKKSRSRKESFLNSIFETLSLEDREKLRKKTHLHLQRKGITHIDELRACKNVRFLFLQANQLRRIGHFRHLHRLQEIYLHDNQIIRLEGLAHLKHLRKLLVPRNRIAVVEGLPPNLEELEVSGQLLSDGDALLLDPQAFIEVKTSLTILDISNNELTEIGAVGQLISLTTLRASKNAMKNLGHVCSVVSNLSSLRELDLRGNPVAMQRRYRPEIILNATQKLILLDERTVTCENKMFFLNAERYREYKEKECKNQSLKKNERPKFDENWSHFLFNPYADISIDCPSSSQSAFVLGSLKKPEFDIFLDRAQNTLLKKDDVEEAKLNETKDEEENEITREVLLPRVVPKPFLRHSGLLKTFIK